MSNQDSNDQQNVLISSARDVAVELVAIAKNDPETKIAAKNVASSAKIITGTVKRALFPLAILNYGYDKAEIYFRTKFQDDMTKLTLSIPAENIVDPKASLAGPALQGLAYSHDEDELKDMYLNLLASSMDSTKAESAHPSYVETIKQLSSQEAKLLKIFLAKDQTSIARLHLLINEQSSYQTVARHILNLIDKGSGGPVVIDMLPAYVENWVRLGLIEVDYTAHLSDEKAYTWVEERPEYISKIIPEVSEGAFQPKLEVVKGLLERTKYGEIFGKIVGITA